MRQAARKCDMGSGTKLNLLIQEDGDVIVSVIKAEDRISFTTAEFCASGTQSHNTVQALHDLYKAMILDEKDRPQGLTND